VEQSYLQLSDAAKLCYFQMLAINCFAIPRILGNPVIGDQYRLNIVMQSSIATKSSRLQETSI
jgi:hypothetical protein